MIGGDDPSFIQTLADQDAPLDSHHPKLSAEISSLFADTTPHPGVGNTVVLVTSDSEPGRICGRAAAQALARWLDSEFLDMTGDESPTVTRGTVHAVTAHGLELENIKRFRQAANYVGAYLALTFNTDASSGCLLVHPLGGFKATIPMLVTTNPDDLTTRTIRNNRFPSSPVISRTRTLPATHTPSNDDKEHNGRFGTQRANQPSKVR